MNVKNLLLLLAVAMLAVACSPDATTQKEAEGTDPDQTMAAMAEEEVMVYPADSVAADGKMSFHGLRITEEGAAPLAQLQDMIGEQGEIATKVSGTIEECCQAKGCWMTMKLADGSDMRVRFKDYGFFVPKDAAGKTAIIEGRAFLDTTTVEMLRHYAEDAGKSQEEIEAITDPEISIAFEATGVIIKDEMN